jgi:hypothetical protein
MAKFIKISPQKRKDRTKEVQIEECYKQREKEILAYQRKNPFSMREWYSAWRCGWLKQNGLNLFSFPSPVLHYRNLFRKSKEEYFVKWREECKTKHKKFKESVI